MSNVIQNKYDFVILFDVKNGNPNGDPDTGNMPRSDVETGYGLVTDVCIKRKIRNYVETKMENAPGYKIYIKADATLNSKDISALTYLKVNALGKDGKVDDKKLKEAKASNPDLDVQVRDFMTANFFDIRTFGAVMTTFTKGALNCGQVRGPVQLDFGRSIDPVTPQEITITRTAITTEEDAAKKANEMGRKFIVPYGLYRMEGSVSANLAEKVTHFSEDDLQLLWDAIIHMFEDDRSAARGLMATRRLFVFKHDSKLGNCPAWKLYDAVKVTKKEGVSVPRDFSDYEVSVDKSQIPADVTLTEY